MSYAPRNEHDRILALLAADDLKRKELQVKAFLAMGEEAKELRKSIATFEERLKGHAEQLRAIEAQSFTSRRAA